MAAYEAPRWSRSKYPLQSPSEGSTDPMYDTPEEADHAFWPRRTRHVPSIEAVMDNEVEGLSRVARLVAGSNVSSQNPPGSEDLRSMGDDSTAVSMSHRSLSPVSATYDVQSNLRQSEFHHDSRLDDSTTHMSNSSPQPTNPWTRNVYPLQAGSDSSSQYRPVTPEDHDEEADTQGLMRNRTLRRTPRSRRIPSSGVEEGQHLAQETEPSSDTRPTKHAYFHMQSTTSDTPSEPSVDLSEADPIPVHHPQPELRPQKQDGGQRVASWGRRQYPLQPSVEGSVAMHDSPPPSDSESEDTGRQSEERTPSTDEAARTHHGGRAAPAPKTPRRRVYPLQAPVSTADLRQTTARHPPPPADEESKEHRQGVLTPDQQHAEAPQKAKARRRKGYPLQTQASIPALRGAQTPPRSLASEDETEYSSNEHVNHAQEQDHKPSPTGTFRRQNYPLQSPASSSVLRRSPTPPPSPPVDHHRESLEREATKPTQEPEQPTLQATSAFRRPGYPLQASNASISPSSPKPRTQPAREETEQPTINPEPRQRRQSNESISNSVASSRRRAYPLQTTVAASDTPEVPEETEVKDMVPKIQITRTDSDEDTQMLDQGAREREIASKVVNQWRRQVYPVQSPNNISPFQRSTTPVPPEDQSHKHQHKRSVHLPKNIRASQNADEYNRESRTIVVCLDGTGDKFDNDNSNIVHLISALKKDDSKQVTYYQAGIGTYGDGGLSGGVTAAMDMAVGSGLGLHVRDAYRFLMHTYKEGDKICIFGFSRGAYTARCLAGMVHKVGLLPSRNLQQIPFAYEFYTNDTEEGWKQSNDFKRTFCIDVNIHFIGCFDSVNSVGFIPRQLPLSSTPNNKPRYFRHAMALDERRAKFKVCRHQKKDFDDIKVEEQSTTANYVMQAIKKTIFSYKSATDAPPPSKHISSREGYGKDHHPNVTDEEYGRLEAKDDNFDTDVLEVWFAGAHADVGGGAVANDERHKLAQIPLRWMIRQAFECDTGIIFKTKVLAEFGLDVHTLFPTYKSLSVPSHGPPPSFLEKFEGTLPPREIRKNKLVPIDKHDKGEQLYHMSGHHDEDWTPEQVEDFYDAMSIINDQLIQAPTWWILETMPVQYKVPISPGKVELRVGMNMGQYRGVDDYEPNLHWTVRHREQQLGYKILARTAPHTKWNVVV